MDGDAERRDDLPRQHQQGEDDDAGAHPHRVHQVASCFCLFWLVVGFIAVMCISDALDNTCMYIYILIYCVVVRAVLAAGGGWALLHQRPRSNRHQNQLTEEGEKDVGDGVD